MSATVRTKRAGRRGLGKFAAGLSMAVCAAFLLRASGAAQNSPSRDALWRIVNTMCVPEQTQNGDPKPCAQVDLENGSERGFAILKDLRGETQFLLIPTSRISGIESPLVFAPDARNYFADAWEARSYVNQALHKILPPDDISLAINSTESRSQDQLHIHIDCVRMDVFEALHANEAAIGDQLGPFSAPVFRTSLHGQVGTRRESGLKQSISACGRGIARRPAGYGRPHIGGCRADAGRRNQRVRSARGSGQ